MNRAMDFPFAMPGSSLLVNLSDDMLAEPDNHSHRKLLYVMGASGVPKVRAPVR